MHLFLTPLLSFRNQHALPELGFLPKTVKKFQFSPHAPHSPKTIKETLISMTFILKELQSFFLVLKTMNE